MLLYHEKKKGGKMSVEIKKVEATCINENDLVKLTEMGNVTEIQYLSHINKSSVIKMLGKNQYVDLRTGEIKECINHESRKDHKSNLYRTFRKIRNLINTNVVDVNNCSWITLTYAENMQDTKRLYNDFEKFIKRFRYYCKNENIPKSEYIVIVEPQGRGAWHCHLLFIFNNKAPFIPNKKLRELWGQGFVRINKLDNVDNVGAYLSAYLGDMSLEECQEQDVSFQPKDLLVKEIEGKSKYIIKGGRLSMYPTNMNIYRCSKGIKKPEEEYMTYSKAIKKVNSAKLTYTKNIQISDIDTKLILNLSQEYYNKLR